jgi:hypothetical protein
VAGRIEGDEWHGDEIEVARATPLVAWCGGFLDAECIAPHGARREWAAALRCGGGARQSREAQ